jgi:hypothetical protein
MLGRKFSELDYRSAVVRLLRKEFGLCVENYHPWIGKFSQKMARGKPQAKAFSATLNRAAKVETQAFAEKDPDRSLRVDVSHE